MNIKAGCAVAAISILSACGGGSGGNGTTFFSTPNANGEFQTNFENNIRRDGLLNANGEGFAYEFGSNGTSGFRATAGVTSATEFGAAPTSGVVTYVGQYRLIEANNVTQTSTQFSATAIQRGGAIVLIGDFNSGAKTLNGSAGNLTVSGEITGNELGGTVTYNGVEGELRGGVDTGKTIGAFHGNEDDKMFAGGFVAQ